MSSPPRDAIFPLVYQIDLVLEMGDMVTARSLVTKARALMNVHSISRLDVLNVASLAVCGARAGISTRSEVDSELARALAQTRYDTATTGPKNDPVSAWLLVYTQGATCGLMD
jgi:tetratricopeptide (TPR) repeat protein